MGIPIVEGRGFDDRDRLDAPRVAIINEAMARRLWPAGDAVGRRLGHDGEEGWTEVVGVAANVRQFGLALEPAPEMYLPYLQNPGRGVTVMVRASGDPLGVAAAVRAEIGRVHPDLPVSQIRTMTSEVSASLAEPRWNTILLALFASVALVLAAVGVYGMVSSAVEQRTREVGVRLALGAAPVDIVKILLKREFPAVVVGIAAGLGIALFATRLAAGMLYEVSAHDPLTLGLASLLLAVVGLAATVVPLRRAMRLPPIVALRND
jgi:putative ABC transport system permease protein